MRRTRYLAAILAAATLTGGLVPGASSAQTAFCRDPNGFCAKMVTPGCLGALGAGAEKLASDDEGCQIQIANYRDCVAAAAKDCTGAQPKEASDGGCAPDMARELWQLAEADNDCGGYASFLEACPNSRRAPFARSRAAKLSCPGYVEAASTAGGAPAAPEPRPQQLTPAALDKACVAGAPGTPPDQCYDHAIERMMGAWRAFTGGVRGKWGLVGANCAIWLAFSADGDALTMSDPNGAAQRFDLAAAVKQARAQRTGFNPGSVLYLSPTEVRFKEDNGTSIMTPTSVSIIAPNGAPQLDLLRRGDALTMQMNGQRFDLQRCK